mmetsp:Transcript_26129/g.84099  ORF Transcript_26129/g.84099 Transcript_26129/m.84099 type:complete len:191 (+) Transcript_26129:8-580(+)
MATAEHALNTRWALWEHEDASNRKRRASYASLMRCMHTFGTVEEFWCLYNNYPRPHDFMSDAGFIKRIQRKEQTFALEAISVFREGILPEWEDSANASGGEVRVKVSAAAPAVVDEVWEMLLLTTIGETLPEADCDVTGLRVVDKGRGTCRFEVWTSTKPTEGLVAKVRRACEESGLEGFKIQIVEHGKS